MTQPPLANRTGICEGPPGESLSRRCVLQWRRIAWRLEYGWVIGSIWALFGCPLVLGAALYMPPLGPHHLLDVRGCSLWFTGHRFILTRGKATLVSLHAALLAVIFVLPLLSFFAKVVIQQYLINRRTKWLCLSCHRTWHARCRQCPCCGTPLVRRRR